MQEIKRRRKLSEQAWRELLSRFEVRGTTVSEFCKREGVCLSSFQRWRGRLTQTASEGQTPKEHVPAEFVDLGSIGPSNSTPKWDIRLELGGGMILRLMRS